MVQESFTLVLHACVRHVLIKFSSLLLSHSLSSCSPNIQQLAVQYIVLYSYIDQLFQYISFSSIFLPLPSSVVLPDRWQFCRLSTIYVCMCVYVYIYTFNL
jgi:hypothetical protein